jgi:hypothetical protein
MRREDILQRGQLAVGAVVWAVIVTTPALCATAVTSHSGTENPRAGKVNSRLPSNDQLREKLR